MQHWYCFLVMAHTRNVLPCIKEKKASKQECWSLGVILIGVFSECSEGYRVVTVAGSFRLLWKNLFPQFSSSMPSGIRFGIQWYARCIVVYGILSHLRPRVMGIGYMFESVVYGFIFWKGGLSIYILKIAVNQ